MGNPYLLPGGDQVEAAPDIEPMGAARHLGAPALDRVELADQRKEAVLSAVNMRAQVDDFGGERFDEMGIFGSGHVFATEYCMPIQSLGILLLDQVLTGCGIRVFAKNMLLANGLICQEAVMRTSM